MAAPVAPEAPTQPRAGARANISARTLRTDRWWVSPLISFVVLSAFVIYATWAAFVNKDYYLHPYISPFYSPCLAHLCGAKLIGGKTLVTGVHGSQVPTSASSGRGGPSPRPSSS